MEAGKSGGRRASPLHSPLTLSSAGEGSQVARATQGEDTGPARAWQSHSQGFREPGLAGGSSHLPRLGLVPGSNTAPKSHSWKACISGPSAGPSLGVQLPGRSATDRGFVLSAYSHHRTGQLIGKVMMSRAEASQDRKDQVIWTEPRNPLSRLRMQGGCEEWPWEGAGQPGVGGLLQGLQPRWPLPLGGSSRLQQDTFLSWSATHLVAIRCGGPGK